MSLKQLVYVSDAPFETSDQTIENILATSRKNNPPNDITGMLIYSNGVVIQALEGEAPIVDRLYATISDDLRHQNVHIISDRTIEQRVFADWAMAYISATPEDLADRAGVDGAMSRTDVLKLLENDEDSTARFLRRFAKSLG